MTPNGKTTCMTYAPNWSLTGHSLTSSSYIRGNNAKNARMSQNIRFEKIAIQWSITKKFSKASGLSIFNKWHLLGCYQYWTLKLSEMAYFNDWYRPSKSLLFEATSSMQWKNYSFNNQKSSFTQINYASSIINYLNLANNLVNVWSVVKIDDFLFFFNLINVLFW